MNIIDLTHAITPDMPVFPGTGQPTILDVCTHGEHGFAEKLLTMYSHTGTHMDAPAHIIDKGPTLDAMDVDRFHGPAMRVDCQGEPGAIIGREQLAGHERDLKQVDFILLHTGWSSLWGQDAYFSGFPILSPEAAGWLAGFGLKGIGLDAISVDPIDTPDYAVHKAILGTGAVIVENLANTGLLPDGIFTFSCFPLKLENADGSPVRAVAMLD